MLQNKFVILKFSLVLAVLTAIVVLIIKPYYDYAVVPASKAGSARTLLTLLAAVLGGFIGAVRVFFRHSTRISSAAKA
jgi:uncharacterized protein involved in exopolysaccharide biosynthesis